jgi:hypothetical protein
LLETAQKQRAWHDPQKTLKSSLMLKTMEEGHRLKCQIQNCAPAMIDHANMALQRALETFVGVDRRRCTLSTLALSQLCFANEGLTKFTPVFVLILAR